MVSANRWGVQLRISLGTQVYTGARHSAQRLESGASATAFAVTTLMRIKSRTRTSAAQSRPATVTRGSRTHRAPSASRRSAWTLHRARRRWRMRRILGRARALQSFLRRARMRTWASARKTFYGLCRRGVFAHSLKLSGRPCQTLSLRPSTIRCVPKHCANARAYNKRHLCASPPNPVGN